VTWGGAEQSCRDASAVRQACQPGIAAENAAETE
jgi:hypothetical protein